MIQPDLVAFLKAITGMSAKTNRVYWLDAPNGAALPYVTVQQVAGDVEITHGGATDLQMGLFQVDCYGATWADSVAIRDLVEGALKGYKGTFGSSPGTTIDAVFTANPIDFVEHETTPPTYRAIQDLEIHFRK